ncbi:chloride channel protein [Embleya sp. NPDC056575]|uniref:chloride channel protein n=1 Tax=Embleya sp. NPDC056575 TaxID=3345869 RepID=UPI0036C4F1EC
MTLSTPPEPPPDPPDRATPAPATRGLPEVLRTPGYLRLLLVAAVVGVPISLAAFGFVTLEHAMQNGLWQHLPHKMGYSVAPWWWPLPLLTVAGLVVAGVAARLPGAGGHLPVNGLGGPPVLPSALPGVVVAALACLSFGAVLGPEGPLMAIGSGLALSAVRGARRAAAPEMVAVLAAAGSAAAIATVFGSPLVAAVLLIEAAGFGGPRLTALILPCLLASGVGAVVFTGFGAWSGLATGGLALPSLPPSQSLRAGDFLWGVPLAAVIGCGVALLMTLGRHVADWTTRHPSRRIVMCAIVVGALVAGYAASTGRSPEEAALSGQSTLATLAANPHSWATSALFMLVLCKGLAWCVSLGSLRGGPIFPVLLLGAATALLCQDLPGFGTLPGLAVGLAAAASATLRLPVSATVLAVLLLGDHGTDQVPVLVVASVVAFVVGELARAKWAPRPPAPAPADPS